jgi:5-methylcytosine-specific restriction endonuclease McrA
MEVAQKERFNKTPMTKDTIEKFSSKLRGKTKPPFSEEHKKKISDTGKFTKPWNGGKNSHFWRGGRTTITKTLKQSHEYREWRRKVFERDNWTCQKCKTRGGNLHPHHIIPLSKIIYMNNIETLDDCKNCLILWDVHNGITLCEKCHGETDTYGHHFLIFESKSSTE